MDIDDYVGTDDALFHYTKLSIGIENILYSKKFKPSLYKNTNDPREYKFLFLNMMGWSLAPEANKLWNDAHPIIDSILKYKCRVMCFCSNKRPTLIIEDEYTDEVEDTHAVTTGWNKSRMWAQYGENHRGLCLVFSKAAIDKMLQENVLPPNTGKTGYVKYSSAERISMNAFTLDGNRLVKEGAESYCQGHVLEHINDFFFTKHIDYRDESEYRAVVYDPEKKSEFLDINSILMGVVAGDRTPEAYFPLLEELCTGLSIQCRRVYWDRGEPHLVLCKRRQGTT